MAAAKLDVWRVVVTNDALIASVVVLLVFVILFVFVIFLGLFVFAGLVFLIMFIALTVVCCFVKQIVVAVPNNFLLFVDVFLHEVVQNSKAFLCIRFCFEALNILFRMSHPA